LKRVTDLKAQNQYNRNISINYYQSYHNTTRKINHQKNDVLIKKGFRCQHNRLPLLQQSGFQESFKPKGIFEGHFCFAVLTPET
jgi:hypothetical protein